MATSKKDIKGSQTFTLKSNELGGQFTDPQYYNDLGFTGGNISPQLYWENVPAGTKSFAVSIHDPDAPTDSGFWHWLIYNIPADVHELKTNAGDPKSRIAPAGSVQAINDYGKQGFGGAAPNKGPAHRYIITVHALDKMFDLPENSAPAFIEFNMFFGTLAKASLLVYGEAK